MAVEYYTVEKATRILFQPELSHGASQVIGAHSLMHVCEHDLHVTTDGIPVLRVSVRQAYSPAQIRELVRNLVRSHERVTKTAA